MSADNLLKVVVLKGSPESMASVEQTIHELDVPGTGPTSYRSKVVELIVSIIGGSDNTELLPGGQISEAMAPVVKQLRAVFPYKNYQLLSSILLRSTEGAKAENDGVMKSLTDHSHPSGYAVGYNEAVISHEGDKPFIHLQNFMFKTTIPTPVISTTSPQYQLTDIVIRTDVDLREGQKIVAGKANIDSSDLALFVVLTARIVE